MTTFRDRTHAGAVLAEELAFVVAGADVLVCALPRGGVPVAVPVAERLGAQLDAVIVRKIRTPGQPELAMGAVARLGDIVVAVRADEIAARIGLGSAAFDAARIPRGRRPGIRGHPRSRRALPVGPTCT